MEQNQQTQPPVFNQPQQPVQPQYQPRVTVRPMMGMLEAIKTCFKKYCNFKGRARRSEFWWFVLLCAIIYILGSFAAGFLAATAGLAGALAEAAFFAGAGATFAAGFLAGAGFADFFSEVLAFAGALDVVFLELIFTSFPQF